MKLFGLFNKSSQASAAPVLKTDSADDFADQVKYELRAAAAEAIRAELGQREGQLMRSILQDSYFSLDSLTIRPVNRSMAEKFEDFVKTHENYDPHFRTLFFREILQSEYRSTRGSTVKIPDNISFTLDFSQLYSNDLSEEESFQVSLKGKSRKFEVTVSLTGPHHRSVSVPIATPTESSASLSPASILAAPKHHSRTRVRLSIEDSKGPQSAEHELPLLIGKWSSNDHRDSGSWAGIDSHYVSRQQLVIAEIFDQCYFFIPEHASLTAMDARGRVLEPLKLYPLRAHTIEKLHLGVDPLNPTKEHPKGPAFEFAMIELSLISPVYSPHEFTPRPGTTR